MSLGNPSSQGSVSFLGYFDVCRKLIGLFWYASFLLEQHQGPRPAPSRPASNTSITFLSLTACLSISSTCEKSVVCGTGEWVTVSVAVGWGLRSLYCVSPWVLNHTRLFSLSHLLKTQVNLSLVFEEQAKKED